jgi:hypothetical protein
MSKRHPFDLSTRDAHGQLIEVGAVVRRYDDMRRERREERSVGTAYVVTSVNEEPDYGDWISTPDGPEQLIHSRIRVIDVTLRHEPTVVLAESVVLIKGWRAV